MAERYPDRSTEALCERIRVIDATQSINHVAEEIWKAVGPPVTKS